MRLGSYLLTSLFIFVLRRSFRLPANVVNLPLEQRLDHLEDFWEVEGTRIGDADEAEGGHNIKVSTGKNGAQSDPLIQWARSECQDDKTLLLPSKSSDENDDPYATILFTDIRAYMIPLETQQGRRMFRLIWLDFLGLGIPGLSSSLASLSLLLDERWSKTSLTSEGFLQQLFPPDDSARLNTAESVGGVLVGREREYRSSFGVVKEWSLDTIEPLDGIGLVSKGRMWEGFEGDVTLVRSVFTQAAAQSVG